jgi:Na+-exporting ATPase
MGAPELPTVEETSPQDTEPPIRNYHDPTPTPQPQQLQPSSYNSETAASLSAWHTLTAAQVASKLVVDIQYVPSSLCYWQEHVLTSRASDGLHPDEAASRLLQYGPNKVKGADGLSVWAILLRQVSNSLTLVRAFDY